MKEPEKSGKQDEPPPPGGRALERLHQFEQERGLEETDVEHPESTPDDVEEREGRPPDTP